MFFTIKLYLHLNCVLMLNWIVWNRTIFIKMDLVLNNLQRLIHHKTQTTNQCLQRVDVHKNLLVSQHWCIHVHRRMSHMSSFFFLDSITTQISYPSLSLDKSESKHIVKDPMWCSMVDVKKSRWIHSWISDMFHLTLGSRTSLAMIK